MPESHPPSVRSLYSWEIQEARKVFGLGLNYDVIRIHEFATWPNTINRMGAAIQRVKYHEVPNAITLGNHLFFPIRLLEGLVPPGHPEHYKLPWLIHELTHTWQYQHMGWRYLVIALRTQIRMGMKAYDFGGEEGLLHQHRGGSRLVSFNLEQQGDIARTYYEALVNGRDVSAWLPFITEIREALDKA